MNLRSRQRGIAMITAILLVAIATILAATIAFQSAMAARRGAASLSFDRSVLVAEGAEALAAFALREDTTKQDYATDSWAQPFGPLEIAPGVVLEASLEELQGRFNLNALVRSDGTVDTDQLEILRRLLEMLKLETKWADQIADWIDTEPGHTGFDGLEDDVTTSQQPPYRTANAYITSTSELLALPDFGRERYLKLVPYVIALPPAAKLNLCTASGELLDAAVGVGHQEYSGGTTLANNRKSKCWPTKDAFDISLNDGPDRGQPVLTERRKHLDEQSEYFRLTSLVTIGGTEFALYSLLKREGTGSGSHVRVLQRSFTPD